MADKAAQTRAGLARARALGRSPGRKLTVTDTQIRAVLHLGTNAAARTVGLSKTQYIARRRRLEEPTNAD